VTRSLATEKGLICVVAILKAEEPFVDEWIAYHRLIGVDHFLLYDNDPNLPLQRLLEGYADYVTVIDWPGEREDLPGRNKQTKAYEDALRRLRHKWVAFIDGDEFIVLRKHAGLPQFLDEFDEVGAVSLTWHLFGPNGHDTSPTGLITASLTRRKSAPGRMAKSINRVQAIASVASAHRCRLKPGYLRVDANKQPYSDDSYPGKTDVAHINHYMCRSFQNWMSRIDRGTTAAVSQDMLTHKDYRWMFDPEVCRMKFFEIANEMNEVVDEYMLKYSEPIRARLAGRSTTR